MFAVIETATGVALHVLDAAPEITAAGMVSPVRAPDIKPSTHSVVEVDAPTLIFAPGVLAVSEGEWTVANPDAYDTLVAARLADQKAQKLAALAARRWQAETGGIVFMGMSIKTDEDTQRKITGAYVQADKNPSFTAKWKMDAGVFVTLDAATIIAIGDAVTGHIQTCFDKEGDLSDLILAAADDAALDAIEIDTGW